MIMLNTFIYLLVCLFLMLFTDKKTKAIVDIEIIILHTLLVIAITSSYLGSSEKRFLMPSTNAIIQRTPNTDNIIVEILATSFFWLRISRMIIAIGISAISAEQITLIQSNSG